jgi:hypothetical protein
VVDNANLLLVARSFESVLDREFRESFGGDVRRFGEALMASVRREARRSELRADKRAREGSDGPRYAPASLRERGLGARSGAAEPLPRLWSRLYGPSRG